MSTRIDLLARSLPQLQPQLQSPLGGDKPLGTTIPLGDAPTSGPTFGDTLTNALNGVDDLRNRSGDLTRRFAAGENVELHEVMAASEEAGLAFDLLVELRNKVVEAYRTVINMQS